MRSSFVRSGRAVLLVSLAATVPLLGATFGPSHARADVVAIANTMPGCSALQPVQIFTFPGGSEPLTEMPAIPSSDLSAPAFVRFSPNFELFVSNCTGGGNISRFILDDTGAFMPHGTISGGGLADAHGLALSQSGELFAANFDTGDIVRFAPFTYTPVPPAIHTEGYLEGLAFSPEGELFASTYGHIFRFMFSASGAAIAGTTFQPATHNRLHGMAFAPWGELFVADVDRAFVYRFRFDHTGAPMEGTPISLTSPATGAIDVAFSDKGELFVTSHLTGALSRYHFDTSCNAVLDSVVATTNLGGVDVFPRPIDPHAHMVVPGCTPVVLDSDDGGISDAGLDASVFVPDAGSDAGGSDAGPPDTGMLDAGSVASPDSSVIVGDDAGNRPMPDASTSLPDAGASLLVPASTGWKCSCRIARSSAADGRNFSVFAGLAVLGCLRRKARRRG